MVQGFLGKKARGPSTVRYWPLCRRIFKLGTLSSACPLVITSRTHAYSNVTSRSYKGISVPLYTRRTTVRKKVAPNRTSGKKIAFLRIAQEKILRREFVRKMGSCTATTSTAVTIPYLLEYRSTCRISRHQLYDHISDKKNCTIIQVVIRVLVDPLVVAHKLKKKVDLYSTEYGKIEPRRRVKSQ